VFENRVPRRIFGPKTDVTGEWRKLHNEELHNLYSLPSVIRMNNQVEEAEMGGSCSTNREKRPAYRLLVGKPD
jgi:hypothetical protein